MKRFLAIAMAICSALSISTYSADINITNSSSLAFGSFAAGSGGTVTVSPAGVCSASGDVIIVILNCAAAEFTITGDPNTTYFIDLPADNFATLSGPGSDMIITHFTSNPAGADGQLSAGGTQNLSVGGTLSVGNNQAAGSYSGSFTVIVDYN